VPAASASGTMKRDRVECWRTRGSGVRYRPKQTSGVLLLNPLGGTLAHYSRGIASLLEGTGARCEIATTHEPSSSGDAAATWMGKTSLEILRARVRRPTRILSTWPMLGLLDIPLLRVLGGPRVSVVLHDPEPLVRALGYGSVSRRWVTRLPFKAEVLVHSEAAKAVLVDDPRPIACHVIPHPMTPPLTRNLDRKRAVIRVLGQFKPDRDVAAMAALASQASPDWQFCVHGRGWPSIPGWKVDSRFIPEREFVRLIETSSVVMIPYRRFFQSGIAIRCLELGVPFVGPAESSLSALIDNREWLVQSQEGWHRAVAAALSTQQKDVDAVAARAYRRVQKGWGAWAAEGSP
jgi:hypothetical protein